MSSATTRASSLTMNALRRRRLALTSSDIGATKFTVSSPSSQSPGPPKSLIQGPASKYINGVSSKSLVEKQLTNGSNGANSKERGLSSVNGSNPPLDSSAKTDGIDGSESSSFESDLVVVLDMDECLIHSQFLSANDKYRQYEDRPSNSQPFHHDDEAESIIPSSCQSFHVSLPDGDLVHVNKRPNLDLFLEIVTKRYETHVFTAAMQVYARPVLDALDPSGDMFQKRFYRDSCTYEPSLGVYVKDLQRILSQKQRGIYGYEQVHREEEKKEELNFNGLTDSGILDIYNERRVVLVDNNPFSFLANPSNGILVSNFYDDPKDNTLEAVVELLYQLESVEDVRPVLDAKFGLKDALKEVSQNNSSWR